MTDNSVSILTDVRYIPDLKRNLISLCTLESKGCTITRRDGIMLVQISKKLIMTEKRVNSLYYLEGDAVNGSADPVISKDKNECGNTMLWHKRLAHMSEKGLQILQKQGFLKSQEKFVLKVCEECIMGKSTKLPYKTSHFRASSCLEYLYCDLWGPARVNTLGGSKYFMSILDNHSIKLWVFLLKAKT